VFHKSRWDDYGYKTQFEVWFHNASRRKVHIGTTKIISKDDGYDSENRVKPENEFPFNGRTEAFCSLGQDNSYYKSLRDSVESSLADYYLDAVNDLAINKGLVDSFEHEKVFKKSLIRSSEAQKALREGYNIYHDLRIENLFTFTFTTQIGTAAVPHTIEFDYKEHINLPHRIKVLIGKNGTGKTQYLARLASTLSGYQELGTFSTKYLPPFSRVLAISYSLFDRFPRPAHTKTYSYYYCGFQGKKGFLTENQLEAKIRHALESVEKADRMSLFGKYLSIVLSDDLASELLDDDFDQFKANAFSLYDDHGSSKYSSGQIIMILVLSEVLAFITSESLLLFDEPETHLHPNGISRFINVLNRILKRFNSYAIISSHSPQLVQEVPSKDITIIDRIDTTPIFRKMDIESFGENLNTITQRVFQTISHDEYYREFLLHLSEKSTYKQIIKSFEQNSLPLSLAARLYLQSLYKK
jgi:ABC-type multidrug transport system ATPase subunit